MATPAAVLDILVAVNNGQAKTALAQTQGQLQATGKTASATGAVMKKAFLGIGIAAAGAATALYKIGAEFDDAYDKIRTQTGATGKDLKKLEGNFKSVVKTVPTDFDSASTAIAGLNQRLNLTGKPLVKLTKQVTQLSLVTGTDVKENVESVTRLFGDWGVASGKQAKTLDGLFRISQKTGTTVSDLSRNLVQFGAPLRNLGIDMDFAAGMFGEFEKAGVNMTTVMSGMRLAVGNLAAPTDDLAKTMDKLNISAKNPEEALDTFMMQIAQLDDQSKATALAIELFGKRAGPDMVDTIRGGKFAVQDLMDTFNNGDETIGKAERSTRDFSEQWTLFVNNLKVAVEPVATKFFDGLGDLMKDVTKTYKKEGLSGVIDLLVDKLSDAIPKVTDVALDIGAKLGKGVIEGFLKSGPIVKFIAGAYFGTKFFNAAKTEAGGRAMGRSLGKGLLVGFALAFPDLVKAAFEWGEKIGPKFRQIGSDIGEWFINGMIDVVNVGIAGINKAMDELNVLGKFGVDAPNIGDVGHVDFSGPIEDAEEARKKLKDQADAIRKNFHDGFGAVARDADTNSGKAFGYWRDSVGKLADRGGAWSGQFKDKVGGSFKGVAMDSDTYSAKAWSKWNQFGTHLNQEGTGKVDNWHGALQDLFGDVARDSDKDSGDAWRYWKGFGSHLNSGEGKGQASKFASAVGGSFKNLANASTTALAHLAGEVAKSLDSYGAKDSSVYVAQTMSGGGKADTVKAQRGAAIAVPGSGTGDKVHAMLEPGEVVLNRKAVAAMGGASKANSINKMIPRFAKGGVAGGLDFALGPYDIPPIQYAADHAGGNSHVHVSGTTIPWVISIGQMLQKMGFAVGEFGGPASAGFGGITTSAHGHYLHDHYSGYAIDVNSVGHQETQSEVASIAKVLGGAGGAALVAKIANVMLNGPDGALKNVGNAALSAAHSVAQKFASSQTPAIGAGPGGAQFSGAGGMFSKPELMDLWTTVNRGLGDPNLMAAIALAESGGNPRAYNSSGASGLWQILGQLVPGDIFDPVVNAENAGAKLRTQGLDAWEVYTSGAYSNFLQKGGIVGKGGGQSYAPLQSLQALIGQLGSKKGKVRHKAMGDLLEQVRGVNLDESLFKQLNDLTNLAADQSDFADMAAGQTGDLSRWALEFDRNAPLPFKIMDTLATVFDPATGQTTETLVQAFKTEAQARSALEGLQSGVLGTYDQKNEGVWLNKELQTLFDLRNALVTAKEQVSKRRDEIAKMLATAQQRFEEARKLVHTLQEKIDTQIKAKGTNEKQAGQIKSQLEGLHGKLNDELAKKPKDRDQKRINELQNDIFQKSGRMAGLTAEHDQITARIADLTKKKHRAERERDGLKDGTSGLIPRMNTQQETLKTLYDNILGEGDTFAGFHKLQGAVADYGRLDALDALGVGKYGGDIGDVQDALKTFASIFPSQTIQDVTATGTVGGVDQTALNALLQAQHIEDVQRLAVSQAQYGVFAGMFAAGGLIPAGQWGIAGERGPEVVTGPAQVYSASDSAGMLSPQGNPQVTINVAPGMEWLKQFISVQIEGQTRKAARGRPLPGVRG